MHCSHLPSLGPCKVFELVIDRANEVELLFAPPGFELFFPNDGCANVFLTLKVEQALTAIGRSETFQRALLMLHDAQIQVAGDANVKRACMAAQNVDVAAGHSKMLAVLVLSPRERPWRVRQARASVVEKLQTAWARKHPRGPSTPRHQARCHAMNL
jgi:hypothetical protein